MRTVFALLTCWFLGGFPCAFAAEECEHASIPITADMALLTPNDNRGLVRSDGAKFDFHGGTAQLLISIPLSQMSDVNQFAHGHETCYANVVVENEVVETRLVASLLPLSTIGQLDKFLSLVVSDKYQMPFEASKKHRVNILIDITGKS